MSRIKLGNVKVSKPGVRFSMKFVIFDPSKKVVTGDEAKKMANKIMKISKQKLKDEYDVIYADAFKDIMGRRKVMMFKPCTKVFANCIFVVPKKWKKEARKEINEYFF